MARSRFNPLSFLFLVTIVLVGLYGGYFREATPEGEPEPPLRLPGREKSTATRPVSQGDRSTNAPAVPPARVLAGYVERVIDGDTFDLRVDDHLIRIRLAGIDAPEIDQPYGRTARDYLTQICAGRLIHALVLELDQNGRSIADVYLQEHWVNGQMIHVGLAWHFKRYDSFQELADEETSARQARLGLWADRNPIPPWDWRRR